MSDKRLEDTKEMLRNGRASTDNFRLMAGIRVAQMGKHYGSQLVPMLAKEANIGKSTLYEYEKVARFLVDWLQFSARRTFELYPFLTYSHIREAVAQVDDFEERIFTLMAVADGDPRVPAFSVSLPMSVDQYKAYLGELYPDGSGKTKPIVYWTGRGTGFQVFSDLQKERTKWGTKQVEVIVKELKR